MSTVTNKSQGWDTWVGFYLLPYVWVGDSPRTSGGQIDGRKATKSVFGREINAADYVFDITVCRDGLFKYHFHGPKFSALRERRESSATLAARMAATRLLNAHLAVLWLCIDNATTRGSKNRWRTFSISPSDLWVESTNRHQTRSQLALRYEPAMAERARLEPRLYDLRKTADPRALWSNFFLRHGAPVNLPAVEHSADVLRQILSHPDHEKLIVLYGLVAKSLQALAEREYDWALNTAWVGIEALLTNAVEHLAVQYTSRTGAPVTKEADRKHLSKARASDKETLLKSSGALEPTVSTVLARVRRARNDWVHSLEPTQERDAHDALDLLVNSLSKQYNIDTLAL